MNAFVKRNERGQRIHHTTDHVQDTFDRLQQVCGISETDVFKLVYGDYTRRMLICWGAFLHDVRTCSPRVLKRAHEMLQERT